MRICFNCILCGVEFVKGENSKKQYCSSECGYIARRGRPVQARKTGEMVSCDHCGTKVYRNRKSLDLTKNKNHFCSTTCANIFQGRNKDTVICKTCSKDFQASNSHHRIYCSIDCRNNDEDWIVKACLGGNIAQQNKKGPNKLEIMGSFLLKKYEYEFQEQVLIANKFLVDILLPNNIIVQWDGDYWHGYHTHLKDGIPNKRQKERMCRDKSQDLYMTKCGYKILRFWEHEVIEEYKGNNDYIRRTISEVARTSSEAF